MSVSAVAPTPFYQDPDRLQIGLPQAASEDKAAGAGDDHHLSMFANDDEPSFWDVLDVVNPLQHIPVVSNIYREMTGDQIGVGARLVGGTLFGGPIGLIASAVDCMVEEGTGKDTGGHVLAMFRDEAETAPTATQVAKAKPDAANSVAAQAQAAAPTAAVPAPSSPATAAAEPAQTAAPVITLPTAASAVGAPQPLVFSLDGGMQTPANAAQANAAQTTATWANPVQATPVQAPADPAALQALAEPKAATGTVRSLQTAGRTLPTPARNSNISANAATMPPLSVPVSNSSARSNTPITGRAPNAAGSGQRTQTSMPLPNTDVGAQTATGPDWFTNAWGQALDKYQRTNQRNDKAAGTGADGLN